MAIVLHQIAGAWGTPSLSPFCTKLQCWLRMADLPYELAPAPDMLRAPRGKVPFVVIDGTPVSDSQVIVARLAASHGDPLDGWLPPERAATMHLVRRTLEEATYFHLAATRWVDDDGWATYRPVFAAVLPPIVRWLAPPLLRRTMRRALVAQGTARRSPEEVHRMAIEDLRAVADVLGDQPFLAGDRPCTADATLFGMVDGLLAFPLHTGVHAAVWDEPRLVAHTNRIRARWFPELGLRTRGALPG